MKTHTFKAIRWLGEPSDPPRYAVVEVDQFGPVLRDGPYRSPRRAIETAKTRGRESRFKGSYQRGMKGDESW
jgi:hypothetical protein